MEKNVRFYKCKICGNVIGLISGDMKHMACCGSEMEEIIPNTVDAAVEKHVPVCSAYHCYESAAAFIQCCRYGGSRAVLRQ